MSIDIASPTVRTSENRYIVGSNPTHPTISGRDIHLVNSGGSSPSSTTNFGQGICLSNPRSRTSLDRHSWDDGFAVSHCSSQCPTATFLQHKNIINI